MTSLTVDEQVEAWLAAYSGEGVVVAHLLCDRHPAFDIAFEYEDVSGRQVSFRFVDVSDASRRLAAVMAERDVGPGDRVATLLPKSPELVFTLLALWRLGAVHVPLFTAFGPDAVAYRTVHSGTKLLVTDRANRGKVDADVSAAVDTIITVDEGDGSVPSGDVGFWAALAQADPLDGVTTRRRDDLIIILYTSGTTGNPKGVQVPVAALASFQAYLHYGLDLRPGDVYWNLADPGWAYGLWYGLVGPMLLGHTTFVRNAPFDAAAVYDTILRRRVSNLAGAPTAFRALRAAGPPAGFRDQNVLRAVSSAGEPLNPEVIQWAEQHLGVPIHDHYGQSEVGMVVCNHHHDAVRRPLRLGSMGHASPGHRAVIIDSDGREVDTGQPGEIAIDVNESPLYWFRGYWRDTERTTQRFAHGSRYYLTADAAHRDADGYFCFASRADDVITSAGYRLGPFEIESTLMKHPDVAEVAVVGAPDTLRGEIVAAFVTLRSGAMPSDALTVDLQRLVRQQLSAHAYPRVVHYVDRLPKTASGKIMRSVLRGRLSERVM